MRGDVVNFRVTHLEAVVPDGVPIEWQGSQLDSGPLQIELDDVRSGNRGTLDYSQRRAQADFNVCLRFPVLAGMLQDLGVDPSLTKPVRAVLHSTGEILENHGFAFEGSCDLAAHDLFSTGNAAAAVLPGQ